ERADITDLRVRDQAEQVLDTAGAVDQRDQLRCAASLLDELHYSLDGAERLAELERSLDAANGADQLECLTEAAGFQHQANRLRDHAAPLGEAEEVTTLELDPDERQYDVEQRLAEQLPALVRRQPGRGDR